MRKFIAISAIYVSFCSLIETIQPSRADELPADGTYDATVTTPSGTYSVPVEVEDGEVSRVYWPNGGAMHLYGAELDGTEASGTSFDGDHFDIEVDGLEFEESDEE